MPRRAMHEDGTPAELSCDGCGGTVRGYFPELPQPVDDDHLGWPKHRCPAHRMAPAEFTQRKPCDARAVRCWTRWWRD